MDLTAYLATLRQEVETALDRYLPSDTERPATLHRAMRYSLLGGGKRLRPVLCLASAEAVGDAHAVALLPAVALECLHTYTLIHDDLPAMDNDDLRRGQPTCHKKFGEATAILAGDALLTFAFELLARATPAAPLARELAEAAGSRGVVGGQAEDLAAEGRAPDAALLDFIHTNKTGKLIRAACRMGALAGGTNEKQLAALTTYAEKIGLAFQIADDVLNVTSTPEQLGKAVGSDAARKKMTYVALYGLEPARAKAAALIAEAQAALAPLGARAAVLVALAEFTVRRTS
ncbi:MAG: polyprenyl synthetase family protein [Verrucomicrobia bacterium]|nr:MAG: polyprenyl synthetase family protein [Verrucomicrobiota bacterium]